MIYWAAGLFVVFMAVAWWYYPYPYSFAWNNISRLGRPSYNPQGHVYSFIATTGSALLMVGFYASLWHWRLDKPRLDRLLKMVIFLGYITCGLLITLAIFNGDYKVTHRWVGASYFSVDLIMMLTMAYFAYRHPKIHNGLVVLCLASALFDLLYLQSFAKWSWAEWTTVAINYGIGIGLALQKKIHSFK